MTGPEQGTDRDVVDELSESIAPLGGVDPADSIANLDAVGDAVGDADVVGLGEASHGTREFFQLKRRLFRYLVERRGLRLLGLEANFAAVLDVNEYVLSGAGTARDALSQDSIHGVYRTESMLALIEWCRSFNEGRDRDDRIRFHGIDVQDASAAAAKLDAYLERVDPDLRRSVEAELDALRTNGTPDGTDDEEIRPHLETRETVVSTLERAFEDRTEADVAASSRRDYERANRLVWTIEQGRKQFQAIADGRTDSGANVRIRDSAMAAQVRWLLVHEPAERMALWGHNAHLARGSFAGGRERTEQRIPSLGRNLAGLSHVDYYALGLTLGGGSVGAVYAPEDEYRAYEIEAPPEGSLPAVFGDADPSVFFLDVDGLPSESTLAEWLEAKPRWYDIVGGYRDSPVSLAEADVRRQFDGLAFVRETTPARPLWANR